MSMLPGAFSSLSEQSAPQLRYHSMQHANVNWLSVQPPAFGDGVRPLSSGSCNVRSVADSSMSPWSTMGSAMDCEDSSADQSLSAWDGAHAQPADAARGAPFTFRAQDGMDASRAEPDLCYHDRANAAQADAFDVASFLVA